MTVLLEMVLCVSLFGSSGLAYAHHSFGEFDLEKAAVMSGTVVSFEWVSPHTWTRVIADGDAASETVWSFEGMSPNYLGRRGWNRRTIQSGDRIELSYFPLKNGRPGGLLLRVTLNDKIVKVMGVPNSSETN